MTLNHPNRLITFVLSLFLLLPFGCGDDGKGDPPEDAFDSQGEDGEVTEKPFVSITPQIIGDDGAWIVNEDTATLEGTAFRADYITINGERVELGEAIDFGSESDTGDSPTVVRWTSDVDLTEGENTFSVKALDADGLESEPVEVKVTYDPDWVSDPPENGYWVECYVDRIVYWTQKDKHYDPAGSRPDEMHFDYSVSYSHAGTPHTYNYSRTKNTSANGTYTVATGYTAYSNAPGTQTDFTFAFNVYEEDDGFWTGGDDPVGNGSISFTINFTDGWSNRETKTTSIDGNTLEILTVTTCNEY